MTRQAARSSHRQFFPAICPLDCPDTCGMLAEVCHGKVVALHGDPAHPYTKGFICRKMRGYPARVYSPERILHPLKRNGRKGSAQFQQISWPEALHLLAGKIDTITNRYGGEAILPFQYAGNMGIINRNAGYPLYHKLGSSQLLETICSAAATTAWALHRGNSPGSPPQQASAARCIVAWGINPAVTSIHFWQIMQQARKNGAKLIVIDPYRSQTAAKADWYLPVKPGGDGGLALGAMKYLLEQQAVDMARLTRDNDGFEELSTYLQTTPWTAFCTNSGLSQQSIASFARCLADNPKTFLRIGFGMSRNSRGGDNIRAIAALAATLGLFDGGDGRGVLLSSKAFAGDMDMLRFPSLATSSPRKINMVNLGSALTALQPPVRLLMVYNANPAVVAPDASTVCRGLAREDLFTVVHEQVMTPTARYADLILPATTFLENRDCYFAYGHFHMGIVDPVIAPCGEAISNFDLFQRLASQLAYADPPFRQTLDERLAGYLQTVQGLPSGTDCAQLASGTYLCSTRCTTAPATTTFSFTSASPGSNEVPLIPRLQAAKELDDPQLIKPYPFVLITPPHPHLLNSTFGERFAGQCGTVLIHPDDAKQSQIQENTFVQIANDRGTVRRQAVLSTATQPGVLVAEGLFWQNTASDAGGTGINTLIAPITTDIGQGPIFHETRVSICPAQTSTE